MGEAPGVAGTTGVEDEEDTSSDAPSRHHHRSPPFPAQSVNDQRVITFMRNKIVELESKLKIAELELKRLKSGPVAPFSQREEFLLDEMDLISQQLQGWPSSALLRLLYPFTVLSAGSWCRCEL